MKKKSKKRALGKGVAALLPPREFVNADVGRMALSLLGQADEIMDEAPAADARRACLHRAAGYLNLAMAELHQLQTLTITILLDAQQQSDVDRMNRVAKRQAVLDARRAAARERHRKRASWRKKVR